MFIKAVGNEMVKVLPLEYMMTEEKNVRIIVVGEGWNFDRASDNMTIDKFEWTPWFKLSPSVRNLCIERTVDGSVFY